MRLETERLIITEFTPAMARDVCKNSLDGDTARFVPDEVFPTEEAAAEAIAFLTSRYGGTDGPLVYPVLTRDGRNIGYVQMIPLEDGRWEIGYHIAGPYTGQGYATEAVRVFLPVAAEMTGVREIQGVCLRENAASVRVLGKCGFVPVYEGPGDYQGQRCQIFKSVWYRRVDRDDSQQTEDA